MAYNPQPQSIGDCAKIRESCRSSIFEKMNENHLLQMKALSEIKEDIAYQKGCSNGKSLLIPSPWRDAFVKAIFSWGPPILFLIVIGGISLLKSKGWL